MEETCDWRTQHQVRLDHLVYAKIKGIARIREMTIEEWVDETLRKAVREAPEATEAMLEAINRPGNPDIPSPDIEQMLREIEAGYNSL